ncbi:ASCH domain-containing protein [Nonomuraea sp. NPDC050310]|uniref:ASCH domain-containing protein n=1 Tax=unclassified Nonomuraea TaxID=2593643 RepID=UPI00340B12DE
MWGRIDGLRTLDLGTPGEMRTHLNGLVLAGVKTGTSSVLEHDYRAEGEAVEHVGERLVLVDDDGGRLAEVEVTAAEVVPFAAVTWEFAESEGEGFRSVEHWGEAHRAFWTAAGYEIDEHTEIVCVNFRLAG